MSETLVLGQMSGRFVQCCGIGRDVFGKACMVQRFAPFPQGADDGYADTAPSARARNSTGCLRRQSVRPSCATV